MGVAVQLNNAKKRQNTMFFGRNVTFLAKGGAFEKPTPLKGEAFIFACENPVCGSPNRTETDPKEGVLNQLMNGSTRLRQTPLWTPHKLVRPPSRTFPAPMKATSVAQE